MASPTDFQTPSKRSHSPGKPPGKPWFRAIFFTCLLVVCLVAGLVAAALFFIETRPVQSFVQKQVSNAIPGTLSWETFHLRLRSGLVQVSGIHLKDVSGRELAGIHMVEARVDWSGLTMQKIELDRILIDQPVLDISVSEQGNVDIVSALVADTGMPPDDDTAEPSKPLGVDVRVREFKVNKAQVKLAAPEFKTSLSDLSVEVTGFKLADLSASLNLVLGAGNLKTGDMDLALESFDAKARIDQDKISDIDINAAMPGIRFHARGSVSGLPGTITPDLAATLDVAAPLATKAMGLAEDLVQGNGRVNLSVNGSIDDPKARIRLEFGQGSINKTAISGINISAGLEKRHLTFNDCHIDLPAGTIPFGGELDLSNTFPKGFTHAMAGLDTMAYNFFLSPAGLSLEALELGENTPKGKVAAQVRIQGRGAVPGQMSAHADLDVTVQDLTLPQMSGPAKVQFTAGAKLEKEKLTLTGLNLNGPGMTGTGAFDLDMPGFAPKTMTLAGNLDLDVKDMSVPLSLVGQKGEGSAGVHAAVKGALTAPDLCLDINAENLALSGFHADEVRCTARMDKGLLNVQTLTLKRSQGTLNAAGTLAVSAKKGQDHALDLNAEFNRLELGDLAPELGARGAFTGKVTAAGSLEKPQVKVSLSAEAPGFEDYALDSIQAQLALVNNVLTFDTARIQKNNAHLDITGQVNVADKTLDVRAVIPETDLKGMNPAADAALASGRLGLDISAKGSLTAPDISGQINALDLRLPNAPDMVADANAAIEVHGPLDNPYAMQASVHITRLALTQSEQVLILIENAAARLKDGQFNLDPVPVRIMDKGQLTLSANGDIKGNLTAGASGSLPAAMLVSLAEGVNAAQGDILISLNAKGKATAPDFTGSIEFSNMMLDLQALEEPLQKICGRVVITPETLDIQDITASLGDGKITLAGKAELENGLPDRFELKLDAGQVPVDVPDTLEMTLNSQLAWAGTMEKSVVTGQIDIFEGTYYKDVDLSLLSIAAETTRKSRPKVREPGPDFLKTIGLNIYVTRREAFTVDNNLASMSISPNLSVKGTAAAPSLDGRAVVDEGTINFQKAQFEITEGAIDFINPYKIEPEITLTSETVISSYTITLSVSGTPENLDFEFSSDPSATDADILSLIAFGKTTNEMGTNDGDGDSISATAIAKMLADPLSDKIKETTGLSEVSISMDEDDDGQTGVHVSLGADLSRQLSVSYGVDISAGETVQTVKTYYKLLEHLLLSSSQDTSGKLGGELKYRLEFR